jgi:hypothetical protein
MVRENWQAVLFGNMFNYASTHKSITEISQR